ncbi:MAG: ATPase [Bacteroidales bacterium]|nr:ATPase [Bacteroidales bacterium]
MIAIADSGSTKTLWTFVSRSMETTQIHTSGMNPNFMTNEAWQEISQAIKTQNTPSDPIENIYFYGAGCGTEKAKGTIFNLLISIFPNCNIFVETDMLGACRGSCINTDGMVGILGTGSNSCIYKGGNITNTIPALGYTLCDEGSGNHIGKLLLKAYLRNTMPSDLSEDFYSQYPFDTTYFLNKLYKEPFPNRYLASLSPFAYKHRNHSFVKRLLNNVFDSYFAEQITQLPQYNSYNLYLVGSVAFHFAAEISDVAQQYGIHISAINQSPILGLIEYHS